MPRFMLYLWGLLLLIALLAAPFLVGYIASKLLDDDWGGILAMGAYLPVITYIKRIMVTHQEETFDKTVFRFIFFKWD